MKKLPSSGSDPDEVKIKARSLASQADNFKNF
jgi:hypothetical protein